MLIVRDKVRATKRWLISDEIRWLKYGVKTAKKMNCGKMTWSAALASEHDKNRNSSRLVSVDTITLICAKLHQPACCLLHRPATQMLDIPKTAPVTPTITPLNFRNTFFHIDALVNIWSKSDKRLRRYYVIFVATMKNNYAPTESDNCHTADAVVS